MHQTCTQARRDPRVHRPVQWGPLPPTPSSGLEPATGRGTPAEPGRPAGSPGRDPSKKRKGPDLLRRRGWFWEMFKKIVRLQSLTGPGGCWEEESGSTPRFLNNCSNVSIPWSQNMAGGTRWARSHSLGRGERAASADLIRTWPAPGVAGTSGMRTRPPWCGRCGGRRQEDQGVPWGHKKTANGMEGQAKGEEWGDHVSRRARWTEPVMGGRHLQRPTPKRVFTTQEANTQN